MKKSNQGIRNFFKPKQTRDEVPSDRDPTNDNFTSKTTTEIPSVENAVVLTGTPNQPSSSFTFPKTAFGKQNRSCQHQWFSDYKWLDYDEIKDCVTCFVCKKHSKETKAEKYKEEAFMLDFETGKKHWTVLKTTRSPIVILHRLLLRLLFRSVATSER